jgi:hypothetical protein
MFFHVFWAKLKMRSLMIHHASSVQVSNIIISSFIRLPHSDSTYRQQVQKLNDEKYVIQTDVVPQTVVGTLDLYLMVTNHGTP